MTVRNCALSGSLRTSKRAAEPESGNSGSLDGGIRDWASVAAVADAQKSRGAVEQISQERDLYLWADFETPAGSSLDKRRFHMHNDVSQDS